MEPSKILVVDDTRVLLELLSILLRKEGFEVITAESGEEALLKVAREKPDLVLMDIQMDGGMDGIKACIILKADKATADIPVIFLSAHDDTQTKIRGFEAGGVDYIPKAFSKVETVMRVKIHLQIAALQKALRRKNSYTTAILNSQKDLVLIYNSNYRVEESNTSLQKFFSIPKLSEDFSLVQRLRRYAEFEIPQSDTGLIKSIKPDRATKVLLHKDDQEYIYSLGVTKNVISGELKFIVTLSDITMYEKASQQESELFRYKERYHTNQQKDAFKKQLKIIKDQLSNREGGRLLIDAFYQPLDVLSGDAYGTLDIGDGKFLFYIIDAMGKGLSASVTSIQSTSFINNATEMAIGKKDFSLASMVESYTHFIKKQILDDELVCAVFVLIDTSSQTMQVSSYGMPQILIQKKDLTLSRISPNNPPIMSFFSSSNIDTVDFSDVVKMLIYSDGLNENETIEKCAYERFLEEDFASSNFLKPFLKKVNERVEKFDDDMTIIYLCKIDDLCETEKHILPSSIEGIHEGIALCMEYMLRCDVDERTSSGVALAASELLMNAHEHGNLGISSEYKQTLIETDEYDALIQMLQNSEIHSGKSINLELGVVCDMYGRWIRIRISDEGCGFDFNTTIKSLLLDDKVAFQGRGILMAKDICDGIYFNQDGNAVTVVKLL